MLLLLIQFMEFYSMGEAILLGGNGCCCSCGIPMPAICGCQQLQLPVCPPPIPCPAPSCPICQICPPPQPCPPPPVAVCPAPQPVYLQPNCGCGGSAIAGSIGTIGGEGGFQGGANGAVQGGAYSSGPQGSSEGPPPFPQSYLQPGSLSQGYQENSQQGQPSFSQTGYAEGQQQSIHTQTSHPDVPPASDADILQHSPQSTTLSSQMARKARGTVTISENKCNSAILEDLLTKNIDGTDPVLSKRAIHKAAQENVRDAIIDIICSDAGFTYIVSTSEYCEAQKEKVICFLYKKP